MFQPFSERLITDQPGDPTRPSDGHFETGRASPIRVIGCTFRSGPSRVQTTGHSRPNLARQSARRYRSRPFLARHARVGGHPAKQKSAYSPSLGRLIRWSVQRSAARPHIRTIRLLRARLYWELTLPAAPCKAAISDRGGSTIHRPYGPWRAEGTITTRPTNSTHSPAGIPLRRGRSAVTAVTFGLKDSDRILGKRRRWVGLAGHSRNGCNAPVHADLRHSRF